MMMIMMMILHEVFECQFQMLTLCLRTKRCDIIKLTRHTKRVINTYVNYCMAQVMITVCMEYVNFCTNANM